MSTQAKAQKALPIYSRSLFLSGQLPSTTAPRFENGVESTTVAEIAIAITNPATPTDPVLSNGTDKGIRAPRMPALEAKAEVKAAVAQTSNAPNNGVRRPATLLPTIVMVPVLCSSAM